MALPGYPATDYNRGRDLLNQLGSFWAQVFEGRASLQTHLRSVGNRQGQNYLNMLETTACVSRFTVPVFHQENWYLLTLLKSTADAVPAIYQPDDLVYGPQPGTRPGRPEGYIHKYGGSDSLTQTKMPLPGNLVWANKNIQNKVILPSKTWVFGVNYTVDTERKLLIFDENLFTDPSVPRRDVIDEQGNKIDEEISLWLYQGDFDLDYVYIQFGYALGLNLPSTEFYKILLNAFWDLHLLGPSKKDLTSLMSAAAGAPTIIEAQETVEVVQADPDSWLIVTDAHVYRLPLTATPTVAVGSVRYAGDTISDAVEIFELDGASPDLSVLPQLTSRAKFLSGPFVYELTFHNAETDLVYEGVDTHGKAVVKFYVGGHPADVDAFFAQLQANGVVAGKTLANYLDIRANPVGEPTADNLPKMINPLDFILRNLMKNNLFVIRVRPASFASKAPGVQMFQLLREVMPPHTTYVVFIEAVGEMDIMELDDADQAEETVGKFKATAVTEEAAPVEIGGTDLTYEDILVSARLVSPTCL